MILVGSGKGGVGKSFVSAGLSIVLSQEGHLTGLLDIDLHGASLPQYLGVKPPITSGPSGLEPKKVGKVRVMSVGFFTGNKPVPLKGDEKQVLISQLVALTNWGNLDYLVVDMPPGTGDEFLAALRLFSVNCKLLLVTTPSTLSIEVVSRLSKLAMQEEIAIAGIVLNMSYIKRGGEKFYPFGRPNYGHLEDALKARVLVEIPVDPLVNTRLLQSLLSNRNDLSSAFRKLIVSGIFSLPADS